MIEQYVYNLITADATLQALLTDGAGGYHIYPGAIKRGVEFNQAITFTNIITNDDYPTIQSRIIQFNIFAKTHTKTVEMGQALASLFNEDNLKSSGGVDVVFSIRQSESDVEVNFDDGLFQREATYYFKIR